MSLIDKYKELPDHVFLHMYRRRLPRLVSAMRSKAKIRVLFVLHCVDKWKTEALYQQMLQHDRFEPLLGLAMSLQEYPSAAMKKFEQLKEYVVSRGYQYEELCQKDDLTRIAPDIIFYVEPYNGVVNRGLEFRNAPNALFCFSTYGIHTVNNDWAYSSVFYRMLWQDYYESELATRYVLEHCSARRSNLTITGTPFADLLMSPSQSDPWKPQSSDTKRKKRIIYAPHYSIVDPHDANSLYIGTFLQHGEAILSLAQRTAHTVQWAFKPHPCLWRELVKQWGEDKTAAYYNSWNALDNAQLAEGQYLDLFKHSDAMIHDCSSFVCEYLYMQRPVLYLDNGHPFPCNYLAREALAQHSHATDVSQIEQFVNDVIADHDPRADERRRFVEQCLLPPHGRTATDNIINAILGTDV